MDRAVSRPLIVQEGLSASSQEAPSRLPAATGL